MKVLSDFSFLEDKLIEIEALNSKASKVSLSTKVRVKIKGREGE
jgi:hypothetical protein